MAVGDPPPAEGVRLGWAELPERVRAAVEAWLGSRVVTAATQRGGFSPGLAARLQTADGVRVFLKAVGPQPNPHAPLLHRREAAIAARLPPAVPAPRLLWTYDDGEGGWIALAFEDIEGRQPLQPWRADELARVLDALVKLAAMLTPSPVAAEGIESWLANSGRGWRRLRRERPAGLDAWSTRHLDALAALEGRAASAASGETLLHFDIRADNLLLTPERVYFVDWPHAHLGAAWVDLVFFAPSVSMQGGPDPEVLLRHHPAARAADADAVTAVLAAVTGFFLWHGLQPPPPGLPTVRPFQLAQGAIARAWLARRTGWR